LGRSCAAVCIKAPSFFLQAYLRLLLRTLPNALSASLKKKLNHYFKNYEACLEQKRKTLCDSILADK
jgi:predicted phosphoadenosine phosphosulfate sulfurtransferase